MVFLLQGPQIGPVSLPVGWRAQIVNDGNLPSREEHVFANEVDNKNGSQEVRSYLYFRYTQRGGRGFTVVLCPRIRVRT